MKQHFKDLSDYLEKCQFTTHGVLCSNRSCHHTVSLCRGIMFCKFSTGDITVQIHKVSCSEVSNPYASAGGTQLCMEDNKLILDQLEVHAKENVAK